MSPPHTSDDPLLADAPSSVAVLVSGGADSAILLAEFLRRGSIVHPLYVRCGLAWEAVEYAHLTRFLAAVAAPELRLLTVLEQPVADLYPSSHWSRTGVGVPGADTTDDAVFLPGRNVLLLAKALLWCHLNGVAAVATAPLEANPFPDATPEFFADYARVVSGAVAGDVRVLTPYRGLHKDAVLRRGRQLPLELTFSCIRPVLERHCGACNKCAERRDAFAAAGLPDRTPYFSEAQCSA
jgi:7-cyano-7-deazaguanine synthase